MNLKTKKIIAREGLIITGIIVDGYFFAYIYVLLGLPSIYYLLISPDLLLGYKSEKFDLSTARPVTEVLLREYLAILFLSLLMYISFRFIIWAIRTLKHR